MQSTDDSALLRRYADDNSDEAFAALVARHINLVYSVALRQVGNPHAAQEITQAVFVILARKAAQLRHDKALSSWLFQTTRLAANNFIRSETRRQRREGEAYMQSVLDETGTEVWSRIAPLLDSAVAGLREKDRQAILLRFYEGRNLRDIGLTLGASEDAAEKRVNRALEKLRKLFTKRGIDSTTAAITEQISAHSVQAAPVALVKSVTAVALGKTAAASASTLTLVKGTSKIMAWTKMKTAIAIGVGVLFATGTVATGSLWGWFAHKEIPLEAQGTVTYAMTNLGTGISSAMTEQFTVARNGSLWKIRTVVEKQETTGPLPSDTNNYDLYWEMGFDGTNLYTLEQQDKEKLLPTVPPAVLQRNPIFADGSVQTANSPPHNDAKQFYPVWLAYCSAQYFRTLKSDRAVAPRFAMRDFLSEPVKRIELTAKWNMNDRLFLKDANWYSDGTTESTGPDGKRFIYKYPPPYDKPFVEGHFEILSWTNWNGISVPANFKLTAYRPDYASTNVANFVVAYTMTGLLGQIQDIGNFSPVPQLNMATRITDLRIKVRPGLQPSGYITTNRWDIADAIHPSSPAQPPARP